jgi:hypothetical protein
LVARKKIRLYQYCTIPDDPLSPMEVPGMMAHMNVANFDYARLSENAMAAADQAETLEECQALLMAAVRYASLASVEHHKTPDLNVREIRPGIRR